VSSAKMVKVGGEILYSTCTMTVEENEYVLDKFLKKYPFELLDIELPVKSIEAFTKIGGIEMDPSISKARRILPWDINSEGFFVAKLRKTGETESPGKMDIRDRDLQLVNSKHKTIKKYLQQVADYYNMDITLLDGYKYMFKGNDIFFVNADWQAESVNEFLRVGTKFGSINKGDTIQVHTLAAQIIGNSFINNVIELTALQDLTTYMSGGTIKRDFGHTGAKVITYGGLILGMAVNSKDGLKSQFPRALRTHEIIFS
jgi:16S rRNA (cytosine1407-C5)-methyltransferase